MISLAKSSTVELAFGGIGINNSCPLPTNLMIPGNVAAGGSSTGSATAIFSGLAPIGIGTDTAGSVRIPAAWHGLVALKPSLGMISMNGVIPLSKSNDTLGVISKCVKDARLIFQILSEKKYNFSFNQSNQVQLVLVNNFTFKRLKDSHKTIIEDLKMMGKNWA